MLAIDEAIKAILDTCKPITESFLTELVEALNSVLAEDQKAAINMPPFDNSAMDGFVVNSQALGDAPYTLPISQTIMAGHPALPLAANSAARIFTGAIVPAGGDAVIIQENCQYDEHTVSFDRKPSPGDNIRSSGEDAVKGSSLLNKGLRLRAQDISLLAASGIDKVMINRPLNVAIMSTGDELITPPAPLQPAQIYNSNIFLLKGLLKQFHANVVDIGCIKDDTTSIKKALLKASQHDLIITTGGVSVGAGDLLKQVVSELGAIDFWKVAIKPGKPLAFGQVNNTPYFGLPGNPVSAFITFLLFVRPYLNALQGETLRPLSKRKVTAQFSEKANPTRQNYLRVNVDEDGLAHKHNNQSSGALSSMSWANALAEIPPNTAIEEGDSITVVDFTSF